MDEDVDQLAAPAPTPASDPKDTLAREIYAEWRNTHLNHLAVEFFNRLEAEAEHLIALIRAKL